MPGIVIEVLIYFLTKDIGMTKVWANATVDFIKKSAFSVHPFNEDHLSIPERPGSQESFFHEIPGSKVWANACSMPD